MHKFIGLDANGTDGSDPAQLLAIWQVDDGVYKTPNTLSTVNQLLDVYAQAGYDTSLNRTKQRIFYYEQLDPFEVVIAIIEQINTSVPTLEPALQSIVDAWLNIKSQYP